MRKFLAMVAMLAMVCCLSGCSIIVPLAFLNGYTDGSEIETEEESTFWEPPTTDHLPTSPAISEPTTEEITDETTTEAVTEETTLEQVHSEYYIPGLDVDTLIQYFNEVVLDAEYSSSGNASLVQKWDYEIKYYIHGNPTAEDLECLENTADYINSIYSLY